jgi:hypothetical protein
VSRIQTDEVRRPASAVDGFAELEVADPSFVVEKLGGECGDLQGLRELTVNGGRRSPHSAPTLTDG